jgi:hypothetical protein
MQFIQEHKGNILTIIFIGIMLYALRNIFFIPFQKANEETVVINKEEEVVVLEKKEVVVLEEKKIQKIPLKIPEK